MRENKSVFINVRETEANKTLLEKLAERNGFRFLGDFIREQWRKWL